MKPTIISRAICAILFFLALNYASASAQQQSTDGATPLGLSPGAPAGSYSLSGFEDVNLFNGTLNFSLPLLRVGGRGNAGYPLMLRIDHKWLVQKEASDGQPPTNTYTPQPSWWTDIGWAPIYSMGRLEMRQGGSRDFVLGSGGCGYIHRQTLTRLTFTAPDGTEFELRDQATNGRPVLAGCTAYNRGTTFVTADGTAATFVSDSNIFDYQYDNPADAPPSGYMMLRDGTRFRVDGGKVSWMRDRNGNKLTFAYDIYQRMTSVTDSLNRQVTISYNTGAGTYDQITFKGFGGTTHNIKVYFASLSTVLRSDFTLLTTAQMFPELNGAGGGSYNSLVVSAVELPNGKQYQFRYNSYAELTRVVLPTGGAIEYDYASGLTDSATGSGVVSGLAEKHVYRRVIERRVYPDGGSGGGFASRMMYSRPETSATNTGYITTDQYNASGTLLTRAFHYFYGSARASFFKQPTEYPSWTDGREYKTESFASNGTTLLRRIEHTFQQRAAVSWWAGGSSTEPPNDVRLAETVTTLADTNQVSKQTFGYDDTVPFNNQNNVKEYDYGSGAFGSLVRETRTTYLTSPTYTGTSVHIRNLATQVSIFDSGGIERSRTTNEYDNYATDTNHAPLINRASISGLDSAFNTGYTARGNVTGTTSYMLSGGTVTASISSYAQFDIAGNVIKTIDPRGYATELFYTDCFGAPNGEARTNSAPTELSGLSSYAFPTSAKNSLSQWTYSQFDYYLGQPVDGEDRNGVVASGYYNDGLDRLTQIRRAAGTAITNQTTFGYDDTNRVITTSSDRDANNDNLLVTSVLYDQMGRTIETRLYEGGTNYIATQSQYDVLGRLYKTSNPFRPWLNETAVWTTVGFDGLGRTVSVTTPDNAVVASGYSGNSATVTDPALKKRKRVTDALGRLRQVYEDPDALNQLTSYDYDVLDDLTTVTQGTQTRTFVYDSLKRLTSATNPETGTISYQYDNNSNMVVKTDARGVSTHLSYDAVNRLTRRWYNGSNSTSSTTHNNPTLPSGVGSTDEANLFYDSQALPSGAPTFSRGSAIGRLVAVTYGTSSSTGDYFGYDELGKSVLKIQQIGSVNYQMSATFNIAGAKTAMVYPSGHTVNYTYDAAGRTSTVMGNLGDGTGRSYATELSYSVRGALAKEKFGTQTAVYHKRHYNIRGQLFDVRASNVNDEWGGELGAIANYYSTNWIHGGSGIDNNGNLLRSQTIINSFYVEDRYSYDALNRLSAVSEYQNGSTNTGMQQYDYDRWGNRTINSASWGTGISNKQFTKNSTNNQLGVPVGQSGVMSYDAAGNLTNDTYTGAGNRTYDAENKITSAWGGNNQAQLYNYDGNGQRIKRTVEGVTTWQVYGLSGELLAEYGASGAANRPQKEYGYRNNELLVTAAGRVNVALAANGGVVTASSSHSCCGFSTAGVINGNNRGPWGNGEGWNDATPDSVPDWIQVDFAGSKTINEIDVFSLHDNYTAENTPTETQLFTLYGLLAFDVQYWNGSSWVTVSGGSVTGNNKVWRKFTFAQISTNKIRVWINAVPDSWSRVVEIQAYEPSTPGEKIQWLVSDHLGTPRMVIDQTGSSSNVKRHDYLPFGEELFAGAGGRTSGLGYSAGDGVRQQFTSYERDSETNLDFAGARYYSNAQGRFTSVDPLMASAVPADPQSFNRYSYVTNRPLSFTDPTGMFRQIPGGCVGGDLATMSLTGETTDQSQQLRQPKPPSQSTPTASPAEPQVPTSVTSNKQDPKPYGNLPLGPNFYFSGMGALIEFTIRDQRGAPLSNVTTAEAVTPAGTIQNADPVTRTDGTFVDLVGRGIFGSQLTNEQARAAARDARNTPNTIVQDHVLFIMSPGGSAIATHTRTFSNVDANGNLSPVVSINGVSNNYTLTLSEIKVTQIQPRICLGVFR